MIAADVLEMQAGFYRLLSALYRYPLRAEMLQALAGLRPQADSPLADGLRQVQAALDVPDVAALHERLNVEMTRLMEGPGLTPAPPYASFYLDGQQLMGPSARAARRVYLEWRALPEQTSIPADHIALELGFLTVLAERAITDDEEQQLAALRGSHAFLLEQVQPWLSRFCADLESNSREPFFAALARLTLQAIESERAWLEDVLFEVPALTNNG